MKKEIVGQLHSRFDGIAHTCQAAGHEPSDHFLEVTKIVERPPAEDIKKIERRLTSDEKKLPRQAEPLPELPSDEDG